MFRWLHDRVGTNWRLTGPQAAIGLVQLGKLDEWRAARARNSEIWTQALGAVPGLRVPLPIGNSLRHAFYKLYFYVDSGTDDEANALRAEILRRSIAAGLRVFSGSCSEIYREQAFSDLSPNDCPVSRSLGARSLMVEVHPTLREDLLRHRADRLAEIAGQVLKDV
jgi:dTDP-4-amino-4,6-dideoxygalactose transaminase